MLIGYSSARKAYKLWDADLKRAIIARGMTFDKQSGGKIDMDAQGKKESEDDEIPTVPATEVKPREKLSSPSSDSQIQQDLPPETDSEERPDISHSSDSQPMTAQPILRRSARVSRPPQDFWIAPSQNAYIAIDICNLAANESLLAHDVSYVSRRH